MVGATSGRARVALGPLAADASGQLDVLGHDGHALGVDGAQVGVLEQADEVGLGGFLEMRRQTGFSRRIENLDPGVGEDART
jgi:hypothetical protein